MKTGLPHLYGFPRIAFGVMFAIDAALKWLPESDAPASAICAASLRANPTSCEAGFVLELEQRARPTSSST